MSQEIRSMERANCKKYRTFHRLHALLLKSNSIFNEVHEAHEMLNILWTGGALYAPYRLLLISNKLCD